jgi:hypothetical protein
MGKREEGKGKREKALLDKIAGFLACDMKEDSRVRSEELGMRC